MQHGSTQQFLRPPGQRVAKRNARKEKLVKCVLAPRRPGHHPPRDGSIDLAEDPSVPEGQPKSTLAPIRRPPSRGGPLHRSAPKRPFLLDRARPVFFSTRWKRKWGVHPRWTSPPAGAESPWPPSGGPYPRAADCRPYGVYRVRIFPNPCNESPAKRTYLTERRENPHGRYGTDLPGPCQDRL